MLMPFGGPLPNSLEFYEMSPCEFCERVSVYIWSAFMNLELGSFWFPFKISEMLMCPSLGFLVFEWLFFFSEFVGPPSESYL